MVKNILVPIIFFYILVLFQTSFLIHFDIFWVKFWVYSPILILVILLNFFENPFSWSGVGGAFAAGFFLDVFSEQFIGFHVSILVGLAVFIKFILKKYVRVPFTEGV